MLGGLVTSWLRWQVLRGRFEDQSVRGPKEIIEVFQQAKSSKEEQHPRHEHSKVVVIEGAKAMQLE
jgi:hypothetical protein